MAEFYTVPGGLNPVAAAQTAGAVRGVVRAGSKAAFYLMSSTHRGSVSMTADNAHVAHSSVSAGSLRFRTMCQNPCCRQRLGTLQWQTKEWAVNACHNQMVLVTAADLIERDTAR
jgi:hypothetical protein